MTTRRLRYGMLVRDSVRSHGVRGTVSSFARGFVGFLRDSLPSRRRLRFGDLDFDFEQRVDTTWSNVSACTRFREIFAGRGYQPTDPFIFREMMQQVGEDLRGFTFIDLGCGKGRALLLARDYPFRRIFGVELLPELYEVAVQNLARLPRGEQGRFEVIAGDARQYAFPLEPIFLYLFDPFPAPVLAEVLAKLVRSVEKHPRPAIVAYQNPVSEFVFESMPQFGKVAGTQQWVLYRVAG